MYFHVILFNFASEMSSDNINKIFYDLGKLRKEIPQIVAYHFGANDSDNVNNKNFEYCFIMTFANKEDRYIYQNHPAHQDFISNRLNSILNDFVVFDFND